jgi:hypothetical protein
MAGKLLLLPAPQGSVRSEWPRMRAESLDLNEPVIVRAPSTVELKRAVRDTVLMTRGVPR